MQFEEQYYCWLQAVESSLSGYLPAVDHASGGKVYEAARYSLMAGGKRIRPVLALGTASMLNVGQKQIMPFACAIEMIHTYSLIHDDLPCMDNDVLRRGKPTCHVVYGEAAAVLAGDLLLNRGYEIMLDEAMENTGGLQAAGTVAFFAGGKGMIGGQMLDLEGEDKPLSLTELEKMHSMKTGALLKAPVLCAAALAGASSQVYENLEQFAAMIGLAFQIQDDILDTISDSSTLGKTTGKDLRDNKSTYVNLLGMEKAAEMLRQTTAAAQGKLQHLRQESGLKTDFLELMSDYLLRRNK